MLALAAAIVLYASYVWRDSPVVTYRTVGVGVAVIIVGLIASKLLGPVMAKVLSPFGAPKRIDIQLLRTTAYTLFAFAGFVLAWLYIGTFDRWHLRRGSLERITGESVAPAKKAQ